MKAEILSGMADFPRIINLEVYRGRCPCRCIHCPVGIIPKDERSPYFGERHMTIQLFRQIAEEVSNHPGSAIRIHSVGEPLYWNHLEEAVLHARKTGVKTWIFTCAVTDEIEKLKAICRNCDVVEVSVNSTDTEDYLSTKGIDAFSVVSRNIRYMHECIMNEGLPARLIASRVESDPAKDSLFVRFWRSTGLVADAFVRSYHTYNDIIGGKEESSKPKRTPCLVHFARFNINAGGSAVVCFNELFRRDIHPDMILGDVNMMGISEIWHGDRLNQIRKAELSSDYSSLPFKDSLPCIDCSHCQPLDGRNQTSEYQLDQIGGKRC